MADPEPSAPRARSLPREVLDAVGNAAQARASRLTGSRWFWIIAIGIVFLLPIGRALANHMPEPPAMKLALPDFVLTDQHNKPYGLADLKGRVWAADFVFTSCPTVCPKLTAQMQQLQHRSRNLGDAFHMVTFTVDPENDTPERLAAYATTYHADPRRWSFLTGSLGDIETTVVKGFKLAMGKDEVPAGSGLFSIFHGEKLVLVDDAGFIRGYYDADDEGLTHLLHDAGIIINVR
ncbi:MAG: SCO family protein [Byssovorax sp.]